MIKVLSLSFFLLSFSSCSYFSKKFESLAARKKTVTPIYNKKNYCSKNNKLQYISEDENSLKFYKNFHPSIFENKNIPFSQKAIMFSLLAMSRRPDQASPYSRLQVYLRINGQKYYYDFRPKDINDDSKMPFLKGLDYLTQKFIPSTSLSSIAAHMDSIVPTNISVSLEFESFLRENQKDLLKNEELTARFFKGDEILTRYESFNRISYKNIVDQYIRTSAKNSDYEFNVNGLVLNPSQNENFTTSCNYNLSQENTLQDEILNSEIKKSHYIALSEEDNFFLAVTSNTLIKPFQTTSKLGYFIKSKPSKEPLPICEFEGKNQDIVLFSSEGRNPVQHLQHLVSYEIDQIDSSYGLNELLNFSRHLFLSNPDRILYESKRGRKAQLDFFLAMNFPIYHVENLGNIFGHATFKNDNKEESILYSDDRSPALPWCKE